MDLKEIKRLISIVEEANISHFSVEEDGVKIEVKKEFQPSAASVVMPQVQSVAAPVQPAAPVEVVAEEAPKTQFKEIKSQMVGTYYEASSPGSPAFVKKGDRVSKGQVICIVEAMKLFNEIEADFDGVIEEICVENGQSVEFGQVLFLVS